MNSVNILRLARRALACAMQLYTV